MSTPIPLPRLGIDLLSDETQMPAGTVRAAINVDIDKRGQFKRRDGHAPSGLTGEFAGDLHRWQGRLIAYRNGELVSIDPDTMEFVALGDLDGQPPNSFTEYNGALYICTAQALWVLRPGADAVDLAGSRLPASLPSIAPHTAGGLTAGKYTAAISMLDERGEESPAVLLGQIDVTAGLLLTGLAIAPGCRWRVYLTPPDGDLLYLAEEFDAVFSQYAVGTYPAGKQCETLHMEPLPGGDCIRADGGRIYVARGDTLWFSEPLRPHLVAARHNFVRFVGAIGFVEFVDGGCYVADDRGVWWLGGSDPTEWRMALASDAVAVARSSIVLPSYSVGALESRATTDCAVWLSANGYMVGAAGGQVAALHPERIRIAPGHVGRSIFLTRDGTNQIITLTASQGPASVFGGAIDTAIH